jgi:hypothetical protein
VAKNKKSNSGITTGPASPLLSGGIAEIQRLRPAIKSREELKALPPQPARTRKERIAEIITASDERRDFIESLRATTEEVAIPPLTETRTKRQGRVQSLPYDKVRESNTP